MPRPRPLCAVFGGGNFLRRRFSYMAAAFPVRMCVRMCAYVCFKKASKFIEFEFSINSKNFEKNSKGEELESPKFLLFRIFLEIFRIFSKIQNLPALD